MKPMKFSEAILEGFKMVGGKQCKGVYYKGDPKRPEAVCVLGATSLALYGDASYGCGHDVTDFFYGWEIAPAKLNDEGMPWEHIYGMAVAAETYPVFSLVTFPEGKRTTLK